jgi:hypothetical protein
MTGAALPQNMKRSLLAKSSFVGIVVILLAASIGWLQFRLDMRYEGAVVKIQNLAQLPEGQYLKPALLGYHHLGADVLWLRLVQVIVIHGTPTPTKLVERF